MLDTSVHAVEVLVAGRLLLFLLLPAALLLSGLFESSHILICRVAACYRLGMLQN